MKQPNVFLIGGSPGAGKTTLGIALANRLGYASLSIDLVSAAIRAVVNPATHPDLFMTTQSDAVAYFTDSSPERLQNDARTENAALWQPIERLIRRQLLNATGAVIDSWALLPERVAALDSPDVSSIWIHVEPSVLIERERSLVGFYDRSHDPEAMVENFLSRSLWWNDLVKQQADDHGLRTVYQDGTRSAAELCDEILDF